MSQKLNPLQQEAVEYFGSPLLIVAGAGSGKTRVLTHKIAYLMQEMGISGPNILAITFTNKAAKEMRHRLDSLLSPEDLKPFVGTFHAFAGELLRRFYPAIGGQSNFAIADQADQLKLMKQVLADLNANETHYPPSKVLYEIQDLKNKAIPPHKSQNAAPHWDNRTHQAYANYQAALKRNNALDFGDLLMEALRLLNESPEVLIACQEQYVCILVDEYQDTNAVQYQMVKLLAGKYENLTVVGDFDQNIYSWRGANLENMLHFERDYPNARVIKLEQNYRSTQTILKAANALISHNKNRKDKNLWTHNDLGDPIAVHVTDNEHQEARWIVDQLKQFHLKIPYQEMAVLYRTNAQSRVLEEAFAQAQVPYRMFGGLSFFSRAEIKDIVSYLRLVHNPNDLLAFTRVVARPPRGIGETSVEKLMREASAENLGLSQVAQTGGLTLTASALKSLRQFYQQLQQWKALYDSTPSDKIATLIQALVEQSGYAQWLQQDGAKGAEKLETISELVTMAREEETDLESFLTKVSLSTDLDEGEAAPDAVTLMTVHHAKGLEFDVVVVAGLEEGILPHYKSKDFPAQLEEERRLCYVALTRGRKNVLLTLASQRLIFGELWQNDPSRFIEELPPELVKITQTQQPHMQDIPRAIPSYSKQAVFTPSKPSSSVQFIEGQKVKHSVWGIGTVLSLEGQGDNQKVKLLVGGAIKIVLAKYAPLTVVE